MLTVNHAQHFKSAGIAQTSNLIIWWNIYIHMCKENERAIDKNEVAQCYRMRKKDLHLE